MPAAASGRYTVQIAEFLRAGGLGAVAQAGCGSLAVSRSSRAYYGRHRGLMLPTRRVENPRFQRFYLPDHGQTMVGTTMGHHKNAVPPVGSLQVVDRELGAQRFVKLLACPAFSSMLRWQPRPMRLKTK
jgi:hypothetical protein